MNTIILPDSTNAQPLKDNTNSEGRPIVRSLKELIEMVTGKDLNRSEPQEESKIAEILPFPFLALVGQQEMKLALLLALINPAIGGVLLIGPRGTGKTTAVRSLLELLPEVERSTCYYGCREEDIDNGGIDSVCPECAKKFAEGKPLVKKDRVNIVELPLNARLEDVIGGLDERAMYHERLRLKRGLLAQADQNILYVDEVNLLSNEIVDAILDSAAQGAYTVRRGPVSATYNSRFTLIGSMNPEEGPLRPQIFDRFGLRVTVKGLTNLNERQEAFQRVTAYRSNPHQMIQNYANESETARKEIQTARAALPGVQIPEEVAMAGIKLIQQLEIDSLRAEIALFEAARAYAAAEGQDRVELAHLSQVAPMALRFRKSRFITAFFTEQKIEEKELTNFINSHILNTQKEI